ncbi:MAG: hypothetical protein I8H77_09410 [Comamonadaceae bacterium]|nr:hypothetical protein [Comamonadaceae bacterium]
MADIDTSQLRSGCPHAAAPFSADSAQTGRPVCQRAAELAPFSDDYQQDPPVYVRWAREPMRHLRGTGTGRRY